MSQLDILPDIPRCLTAFAEWFSIILYAYLISPSINAKWVIEAALLGVVQFALQLIAGVLPITLWVPGMIVNIIWMGITIRVLSKVSLYPGIFMLTKAFMLSELIASTGWLLYCLLLYNIPVSHSIFKFIFNLFIYAVFGVFIYVVERKNNFKSILMTLSWKDTLTSLLVVAITFAMSNIGFVLSQTAFHLGNSLAVFSLRMFVNVSGLCLLYIQQYLRIDQYHRREIDNMNHLFDSQYQQYKTYAESTSYINRKAHDLKHQMNVLLAEPNLGKREEYLSSMQTSINNLDAKIETGNGVLDTLLTQKNQYCMTNNINFTCIAKGVLLENMKVMDLVSLFGNAMDNAIEHVEKIANNEKRLITLKLTNKGKMVVLRVDNYCVDEFETLDELPETSKNDKFMHGYGLKSIQYIAQKYEGNMTMNLEDNWFSLQVIFPVI